MGLLLAGPAPGRTATTAPKVQIADPFVELHSGPGRGFPVFHIVERGDWVTLRRRRTDWYELATTDGKIGWVRRDQLFGTLGTSTRRSMREILLEDFLRHNVELGLTAGDFEDRAIMRFFADYRLNDAFSLELSVSQLSDNFTSARISALHIHSHPFSAWRYAPYFILGIGYFSDSPRETLVEPQATDSIAPVAGIGIRGLITPRLMVRLFIQNHVILIDDNRNENFQEFSGGLSFSF